MRMAQKMTKVQMFEMIMGMVDDVQVQEFCEHEIELLGRKGKSENSKRAAEQSAFAQLLVIALEEIGQPVTVSELIKLSPSLEDFSGQKVSAGLKKLVDTGVVKREVEKKVARFSLVDAE